MADARGFRLELEQFVSRDLPEKAAALQRTIVAELLTGIVFRTPVGNHTKWAGNVARAARGLPPLPKGYVGGQARRNWQVTHHTPARSGIVGTDPTGETALSVGYAEIGRLFKVTSGNGMHVLQTPLVWISNPLEYMEPLENGWSRQAPEGMVARALADVTAKYSRPVP